MGDPVWDETFELAVTAHSDAVTFLEKLLGQSGQGCKEVAGWSAKELFPPVASICASSCDVHQRAKAAALAQWSKYITAACGDSSLGCLVGKRASDRSSPSMFR